MQDTMHNSNNFKTDCTLVGLNLTQSALTSINAPSHQQHRFKVQSHKHQLSALILIHPLRNILLLTYSHENNT